MFAIGALNPQVGNDRRNQLLQKLMQQYSGQAATGMAFSGISHPMPVIGAPTHTSSRIAPGGHPEFTGTNFISSFLSNLLGPGGINRAPSNVQSPSPNTPVSGFGPVMHGGPPIGGGPMGPPIPIAQGAPPVGGGPMGPPTNGPVLTPGVMNSPGTMPAPLPTTPGGMVPLGNGVFYNPMLGSIMGTPLGGLGQGAVAMGAR